MEKGTSLNPQYTPKKDGYIFLGWASNPGAIEAEDGVLNNIEENKTVYAVWKANMINITFKANGGKFSNNESEKTIEVIEYEDAVAPEIPSRDGYKFLGWSEFNYVNDPDEDALKYIFEEKTVYAIWKKIPIEFTLVNPDGVENDIPFIYTNRNSIEIKFSRKINGLEDIKVKYGKTFVEDDISENNIIISEDKMKMTISFENMILNEGKHILIENFGTEGKNLKINCKQDPNESSLTEIKVSLVKDTIKLNEEYIDFVLEDENLNFGNVTLRVENITFKNSKFIEENGQRIIRCPLNIMREFFDLFKETRNYEIEVVPNNIEGVVKKNLQISVVE